jgi:hypothetical protein
MSMNIVPGEIYEDGFYHPCLCFGTSEGFAWGVSLIDGSYPRETDIHMGGIRKISLQEAWLMKSEWMKKRP